MTRKAKAGWIVLVVVLLIAESIGSRWMDRHNKDYPSCYLNESFPLLQQPDGITCGPTSVTMLLKYYGHDVTIDQVRALSKTDWFTVRGRKIGMSAPVYLMEAIRKLGEPCLLLRTNLDYVKKLVSSGRPPIVLLRTGRFLFHYVVVIGYHDDVMVIANPGGGEQEEMPVEKFLSSWEFRTDMSGTETCLTCPLCGGKGRIGTWRLGPINACDMCAGTGKIPDLTEFLLASVDVIPNMLLDPRRSHFEASDHK